MLLSFSDSLGNGARLLGAGPWTATINGEVGAFGAGRSGMFSASTTSVTLTVGKTGTVFSGVDTGQVAIEFDGAATVVNRGTIAGDTGSLVVVGVANVTNAGLLVGDVSFGAGINSHDDIFTNFKKINGVIKNGTVDGTHRSRWRCGSF